MTQEKLIELENYISKRRNFIVEDVGKWEGSLEDFIENFSAIYSKDGGWAERKNIYINKKGIPIKNMSKGPYRSIIDTIIAVKSHTNFTTEDVIKYYKEKKSQKLLVGHYCHQIKRWILNPTKREPLLRLDILNHYCSNKNISVNCNVSLKDILLDEDIN